MPRSRGSEVPQRPSPTLRGPRHLRTSSSDSDPLVQQRSLTDPSPKFGQKKLGTRITDLETQLGQAQRELKSLKQQLGSAQVAKQQAQEELHRNKKGNKKPTVVTRKLREKPIAAAAEIRNSREEKPRDHEEVSQETHRETDVFEVPVEKLLVEPEVESVDCGKESNNKSVDSAISELEPEKPSLCDDELGSSSKSDDQIGQLRAMMEEKEKELQAVIDENETLKRHLDEAKSKITSAHRKEEEMATKVEQLGNELEASKANAAELEEKLLSVEARNESLETEMKKMKVQTEQWRKAADAAAAVLSGGVDMNIGRVSERCSSMSLDKHHFDAIFEPPTTTVSGYGRYLGSPGTGDDAEDGFAGGKKKGSGMRMLGDLWKKKAQKS